MDRNRRGPWVSRTLQMLTAASLLVLAPVAAGQSVQQAAATQTPTATPAAAAPVYTPTSLVAEAGLPRTQDGHPDFQGVVWDTNFFPVFSANPLAKTLVVSEAEAKKISDTMIQGMLSSTDPNFKLDPEAVSLLTNTDGLPIVRGERRSRLLVLPADGKMPWVPEMRKEVSAFQWDKQPMDNPEERPPGERCIVGEGQPPVLAPFTMNPREFIQSPGYVVLHTESGDEARIIPFSDTHLASAVTSRLGDSIARWEGETLVIETIGLPDDNSRIRGTFAKLAIGGPNAKVIERFTRLSKDELLYQFTVEDPTSYVAPWLAEYSLFRANTRMYPWSCHEANYSLPNILRGQRVADERVAAKR